MCFDVRYLTYNYYAHPFIKQIIKILTNFVISFHVYLIWKNGQFFTGFRCNRVDEVDQGVREKSIRQGLAGT